MGKKLEFKFSDVKDKKNFESAVISAFVKALLDLYKVRDDEWK